MEKVSFEKIRRLLKVYERERHYKVLLTSKNLSDVRRNPTPYSFPIIPRPLPSKIVNGEHFFTADLRRLIPGSASTFEGAKAEIADRRSAARSPSGPSASIVRVLVQLNLCLDGVKGVAAPTAFLYLVGEANLSHE